MLRKVRASESAELARYKQLVSYYYYYYYHHHHHHCYHYYYFMPTSTKPQA